MATQVSSSPSTDGPRIRFLHTSDLQLGMPFNGVSGDAGMKLREVRLESISRIDAAAREHRVDFVVVAGDVFDANTVDDRVIHQACARFAAFAVPIFAIPGNHDHAFGPDTVFRRPAFRAACPPNLHVLLEPVPLVALDGRVVILPAPLVHRHHTGDVTSHIDADLGRDVAADAVRIGLAHGSVVGFDACEDHDPTNFIDPERARKADLDYLALGDWHGLVEVNARTWYSGAPEPTNFRSTVPGHVLVVEVGRGTGPVVTRVPVARTRWVLHRDTMNDEGNTRLAQWLGDLDTPLDTVLDLRLDGVLSAAAYGELHAMLDAWSGKLLHLRRDVAVAPRPTEGEIGAIARDGYHRLALDRLRDIASGDGPEAADATRALHEAFRLHLKVGGSSC